MKGKKVSDRKYHVVVKVEGREPFTCVVCAPNEWKARTRAMIEYTNTPRNLRGEFVDYEVTPA